MSIDFTSIIHLVLFFVPGYCILSIKGLIVDVTLDKNTLGRTMQYLIHSVLGYILTIILITIITPYILVFQDLTFLELGIFIYNNPYCLTIITIFLSPFLGVLIAKTSKGNFLYKQLRKITNKRWSKSVYGELDKIVENTPTILTAYMKDGTIVQGKIIMTDKDEDNRDYVFWLKDVVKFIEGKKKRLRDSIILNSKEAKYVRYSKI